MLLPHERSDQQSRRLPIADFLDLIDENKNSHRDSFLGYQPICVARNMTDLSANNR